MSGRGSKPGERRGGRQKGTKNKKTQAVIDKLDDMGVDPIKGMADIANQAMAEGDMQLAGQMYRELAQYVAPKRKAVEISGDDGGPIQTSSSFEFIPVGSNT